MLNYHFLFVFFLNDLPHELCTRNREGGVRFDGNYIHILLYVDDMVLVSNRIIGLQRSLDIMYEYFTEWKLTVNTSKSNILICKTRGLVRPEETWHYGSEAMTVCTAHTYLGITFTGWGITNHMLDVLVNQGEKLLASLQTNLYNIGTFHQCWVWNFSCMYNPNTVIWWWGLGIHESWQNASVTY